MSYLIKWNVLDRDSIDFKDRVSNVNHFPYFRTGLGRI